MKVFRKVLLTPEDFRPSLPDWDIQGVLNPGGIRMPDGRIILYVRVSEAPSYKKGSMIKCPIIVSEKVYNATSEDVPKRTIERQDGRYIFIKSTRKCKLTNISHFRKVILDETGMNVEHIDDVPTFAGRPKDSEYGVEDARITKIGDMYYMTYVTISDTDGVSTALAESKDLLSWKRRGVIFQEQNKDAVLFPEKIKGLYVALNRPESSFTFSKPSIWITYSPDLVFWGKDIAILRTRKRSWERDRNGAGPPPIKTKHGWLLIYHGVKNVRGKSHYSAGAALLDLKNPEKILARSPPNKPLLTPTEQSEKEGYINNVVFPTTAIRANNNKDLLIYSGGADRVVTVRKISIEEIFINMEPVS